MKLQNVVILTVPYLSWSIIPNIYILLLNFYVIRALFVTGTLGEPLADDDLDDYRLVQLKKNILYLL